MIKNNRRYYGYCRLCARYVFPDFQANRRWEGLSLSGKKYKVLVVDDCEINRSILNEILHKDYEVIEADSGDAAIEILQNKGDIALVLSFWSI